MPPKMGVIWDSYSDCLRVASEPQHLIISGQSKGACRIHATLLMIINQQFGLLGPGLKW